MCFHQPSYVYVFLDYLQVSIHHICYEMANLQGYYLMELAIFYTWEWTHQLYPIYHHYLSLIICFLPAWASLSAETSITHLPKRKRQATIIIVNCQIVFYVDFLRNVWISECESHVGLCVWLHLTATINYIPNYTIRKSNVQLICRQTDNN